MSCCGAPPESKAKGSSTSPRSSAAKKPASDAKPAAPAPPKEAAPAGEPAQPKDTTNTSTSTSTPTPPPAPAAPQESGGGKMPPPPPPPPPPAGFMDNLMKKAGASKGGKDDAAQRAALFADIAKGTDITKGLRKVSDSEKRHKNRAENEVGKATDFEELERRKAARQEELEKKKRGEVVVNKKEPKMELEGKMWKIENQAGTKLEKKHDVLESVTMQQTVVLDDCQNYLLEITNKVNMVTISNCKNVGVIMKSDVVSGAEVSRGEKIEVMASGKLPSFILDRSTEVMLYTNENSRDVEITSCACTCVNVTFNDEKGGDADPIERPVPEQFVTTIVVGADGTPKLQTVPMEHAG